MKQVVVVGGGAAGMVAAIYAARGGARVTLVEKNEKLGKKLFITGKGRCNVTNNHEMEKHLLSVVSNPKFLYSAYNQFDKDSIQSVLEQMGCHLKVERGERVFPISDHASDVISALQRALKQETVEVRLNSEVKDILYRENQVDGVLLSNGKSLKADAVIVATGGKSYPSTGSTGDGYDFAQQAGHTLVEPKPALVPLVTVEEWVPKLMGLSLRNVTLTLSVGKKEYYSELGEMLFTHFGITGPLVLSASSYWQKYRCKGEAVVIIDLKPALSVAQLDARLLREFEENHNKQFKNSLAGLFPAKLIPVMVELSGIDPEKKCNSVSREERLRFGDRIKNLKLTIADTRPFEEAIITQGGVACKEIQPATMESKLVKGLYFVGEVMDLDALTGGYNLQIAWSTGYLAGTNAAKEEKDE